MKLLDYHTLEDTDSTTLACHHIAFALANATCCETQYANLDSLGTTYEELLQHLDLVVRGDTPTQNASREELLQGILTEITDIIPLIQQGTTYLQNIAINLQGLDVQTCFTEQNEDVFAPVATWIALNQNIFTHLTTIAQHRSALYDLSSVEATSFATFDEQLSALSPYNLDTIKDQWDVLNDALAIQIQAFQYVLVQLKVDSLCLFNDPKDNYLAKFETWLSFSDVLQNSRKALQAYQDACCSAYNRCLIKITNQILNLSKLKGVLFRNATFQEAQALLSDLKGTVNQVVTLASPLSTQDPHSLERLTTLTDIENELFKFCNKLDSYFSSFDVSIEVVIPEFPDSNDHAACLQYLTNSLSFTLTKALQDWVGVIALEDGLNNNERCYTELANDLLTPLENLQKLFALWGSDEDCASSLFCSVQPLEKLMSSCQDLSTGVTSLRTSFRSLHELLTKPTCCCARALVGQSIAVELTKLRSSVAGALQAITEDTLNNNVLWHPALVQGLHETAKLLTLWNVNLTEVSPIPGFVCQSSVICQHLETPCLSSLRSIVSTLQPALAEIGEALSIQSPTFNINEGCPTLPLITSYLSTLARALAQDIHLFNQRLETFDPFPYHNDGIAALRENLSVITPLVNQLKNFVSSFESSCQPCTAHTNTDLPQHFQLIVPALERTQQLFEQNRLRKHAQQFHALVEAMAIFTQHFCSLWESPEDRETFVLKENLMVALNSKFEALFPQLVQLGTVIPLAPAAETLFVNLTQLLWEASALIAPELEDTISLLPGVLYTPGLITTDAYRLHALLQTLAQLFVRKTAQVQEVDFCLGNLWGEHIDLVKRVATYLENALVTTSWRQLPYFRDLVSNLLANDLHALLRAQQDYREALCSPPLCQHTLTALHTVVEWIQSLHLLVSAAQPSFQKDLSEDEHEAFLQAMEPFLTSLSGFLEDVQALSSEDYFSVTCTLSSSFDTALNDSHQIRDTLLGVLTVFDPTLTLLSGPEEQGVHRTVLLRHIVQQLTHLRQALKESWDQVALCPVRTYRADSIKLLEDVLSALKLIRENITSTFTLTTPCLAADATQEPLILNEIPLCLQDIETDFDNLILTLKKSCCSQLTYRIFQFADALNVLQQGITALSQSSSPSAESFIADTFSELASSLISKIDDSHLDDWTQMFYEPGTIPAVPLDCTSNLPLAFLDKWLEFFATINQVIQTQLSSSFTSSVVHPDVYVCSRIPDAVSACLTNLGRITTTFGDTLTLLRDSKFVYSQVYTLCPFLLRCSGILEHLTELLSSSPDIRMCKYCPEDIRGTIQNLYTSNKATFTELLEHLSQLRFILSTYCQDEIASCLHRYNYDLNILATICDYENSSITTSLWHEKLCGDFGLLERIHTAYDSTNTRSLNGLLSKACALRPMEGICQMIELIPLAQESQKNFSTLVQNLASIMLVPYDNSSYEPPAMGATTLAIEQERYYLNVQKLVDNLTNLFNELLKIDGQWPLAITSALVLISADLQYRGNGMRNFYVQWGKAPLCPHMAVCSCEGCDICEHEDSQNCRQCISCADTCEPCADPSNKPWRYFIWQSAKVLLSLQAQVDEFSANLITDCCKKPYTILFKMLKPLSDFTAYFEVATSTTITDDGTYVSDLSNILVTMFSSLEQGFTTLEKACQDARILPDDECRMNNLIDAFLSLYLTFQDYSAEEDEELDLSQESSHILQEFYELLDKTSISIPILEELPSFNYFCSEITFVLPVFSSFFDRILEGTKNSALHFPNDPVLGDTLQTSFSKLVSALEKIASHTETLPITQTPLCNRCSVAALNTFIQSLHSFFSELANQFRSLQNKAKAAYCCTPYELTLTETVKTLRVVLENVSLLIVPLSAQEDHLETPRSGIIETLSKDLQRIDTTLAVYLSARRQLAELDVSTPCYADELVPALTSLNVALNNCLEATIKAGLRTLHIPENLWHTVSEEASYLDLSQILSAFIDVFEAESMSVQRLTLLLQTTPPARAPSATYRGALTHFTNIMGTILGRLYEFPPICSSKSFCLNKETPPELAALAERGDRLLQSYSHLHTTVSDYQYLDVIHALKRCVEEMDALTEASMSFAWLPLQNVINDSAEATPPFLAFLYSTQRSLSEIDRALTTLVEPGFLTSPLDILVRPLNAIALALHNAATEAQTLRQQASLQPALPSSSTLEPASKLSWEATFMFTQNRLQEDTTILSESILLMAERCRALNVLAGNNHILSGLDGHVLLLHYIQQSLDVLWTEIDETYPEAAYILPTAHPLESVAANIHDLRETLTPHTTSQGWLDILDRWTQTLVQNAEIIERLLEAKVPQTLDSDAFRDDVLSLMQEIASFNPWLNELCRRLAESTATPEQLKDIFEAADSSSPFAKLSETLENLAKELGAQETTDSTQPPTPYGEGQSLLRLAEAISIISRLLPLFTGNLEDLCLAFRIDIPAHVPLSSALEIQDVTSHFSILNVPSKEPSVVLGLEAIICSLRQFAQSVEQTVLSLTQHQQCVWSAQFADKTDTLSSTENEGAVIDRAIAFDYEADGLPRITHNGVLVTSTNLLSRAAALHHDTNIFERQLYS